MTQCSFLQLSAYKTAHKVAFLMQEIPQSKQSELHKLTPWPTCHIAGLIVSAGGAFCRAVGRTRGDAHRQLCITVPSFAAAGHVDACSAC